MMRIRSYLVCFSLCWFLSAATHAQELPQYAPQDHLGVATCASGVCHGSVRAREATNVAQNEYVIWTRRDRHRAAYNTLLTDDSIRIAKNLGLKSAHEAGICLDCHADNVAVENRGERFQIDDGVGCEACHGGGETYISTHVDDAATHASNVADGLYETAEPRSRAKLCLSCHLGTSDKMASHDIMGAGHPRISFELDTFGWLQPAHYVIDNDYRDRKWAGSSVEVWTVGQIEAARQTLGLIKGRLNTGDLFPELALFDCHACHTSMAEQGWAKSGSNLPPGSVRLNDANFVMLYAIASVFDAEAEKGIRLGMSRLHMAVNRGQNFDAAMSQLLAQINQLDSKVSGDAILGRSDELIKAILKTTTRSPMVDYVAAEQAIMAVDMLLSAIGQRSGHASWLDQAYESLADENQFDARNFSKVIRAYKG